MGRRGLTLSVLVRAREAIAYYLSIPVVFLGFGLDRAWLASLFYYEAFPTLVLSDFHVFMASVGAASVVGALWARRHSGLCASAFARAYALGGMAFGSALVALACFVLSAAWVKVVGLVLAGSGSGVLYLMWADFYGRMSPLSVITYFSLSVLVGEILKLFFLGLPPLYMVVFAVGLPFLSVPSVVASFRKLPAQQRGAMYGSPRVKSYPWKPVLLILLFFFIFGYAGGQVDMQNLGYAAGDTAVALLMLVVVSPRARMFDIETLNQILLPMLVVCLALFIPSQSYFHEIDSFRYDAGYTMACMLIMIILSNIAWRYNINPVWLSGIQRALRSVVEILGWVAAMVVGSFGSAAVTSVVSFSFEMMVLAAILVAFFTKKGLSVDWTYRFSDSASESLPRERLRRRLAELCDDYGLSARESDVLELLALEQPIDRIAESLFIAPGTVKTHIHRIYQKVGVSTRAELLEVISDPSRS